MANCCDKKKEARSRSDHGREVKLSCNHTVTLIHTDINFRVTDSVARACRHRRDVKLSHLTWLVNLLSKEQGRVSILCLPNG